MTEVSREAGLAWGRENAEAALARIAARIPEPPTAAAPVAEGPAPFTPEWNAEQIRVQVLAEEAATERARREKKRDGGVTAEVTSQPGLPPGAAERRSWALREISEGVTEVIASPDISPAAVDLVWKMPDGQVRVAKSAPPQTWIITPENADAVEAWFTRRQHDADDLRLIAAYGERACIEAGIVAAADAERLVKPRPPGYRDLTRTVA